LSEKQKEMQLFMKKVLNYRKNSDAIHHGKTIHFAPKNGVYILFRIIEDETVVLILNKNKSKIKLDLHVYDEIGLEGKSLKNIITGEQFNWQNELNLNSKGAVLLTTKLN
jgi:hypothetical protein